MSTWIFAQSLLFFVTGGGCRSARRGVGGFSLVVRSARGATNPLARATAANQVELGFGWRANVSGQRCAARTLA